MKIKNMRWGYDGGGIACGPVPGSCIAEVEYEDQTGEKYFIADSLYENFELIMISRESLFQALMNQDYDEDMIKEKVIESYETEITEEFTGEEYEDSKFRADIEFVRFCLNEYVNCDAADPTEEDAKEFVAQYAGKDANDMDLPLSTFGCIYEEDEEDEDEE